MRSKAVWAVAERSEDEVDAGSRPGVLSGGEVEAIERVLLEVIGGPEQRVGKRLGAQRDDQLASRPARAIRRVAEHVNVVDADRAVTIDCRRRAVIRPHRRDDAKQRCGGCPEQRVSQARLHVVPCSNGLLIAGCLHDAREAASGRWEDQRYSGAHGRRPCR